MFKVPQLVWQQGWGLNPEQVPGLSVTPPRVSESPLGLAP